MTNIAIVTDSTANLSPELQQEYGISVIPLTIHWGDDLYFDEVTLPAEEFYRMLPRRPDLPTTSQPSGGAFRQFFAEVADRTHCDTILGVFISSRLSGTWAAAHLAKQAVPRMTVEVVDSRLISLGTGFLAMEAARLAKRGATLGEIIARLHWLRERIPTYFAVGSLDYLKRGGRIGGAAHLLGTLLNIKPVLKLEDGMVNVAEKVRSRRRSLLRLVELAERYASGQRPIEMAVMHTGLTDEIAQFIEFAQQRLQPLQLYTGLLTPVIGSHTGPGTVGLGFYTEP